MRKVLVILFLILTACTNTISDNSVLYMDPISEGSLYDVLSDDLKNRFESINNSNPVEDYVLNAIGKPITDLKIKDIDSEEFSFPKEGKVIIEAVAYWCPHCKKQIDNNNLIASQYPDIKIFQYFNEGDKEQILEFYEDKNIPEDIDIIPYDEDLSAYIMSFKPQYYPTFFFFEDGVCTYICHGDIDTTRMSIL